MTPNAGTLTCAGLGITSISGMEYLTNLTLLDWSFNNISDVSPLSGLINLALLSLRINSTAGQGSGNVDDLITLTSVIQLFLASNTGMSCAEANTLICGAGNTVSSGICNPSSAGPGAKEDINANGLGNLDTPTTGSNCTNP